MSKKLTKESSEQLSEGFVNELSCNNYMLDYQKCIVKNRKKQDFRECVKDMDKFRFCMVRKESDNLKGKNSGVVRPELFK